MALVGGFFDNDRHPRGYHGRFSGRAGTSSNAHAMRVRARPADQSRRQHAVVPHISGGMIKRGIVPLPGD